METEKFQINFGENVTKAELILREGEAIKELEPKAPVETKLSGVLGTPFEYLLKRVKKEQFQQSRSYLTVNREKITLELIINENDAYHRGSIKGTLEFHPKFKEFEINSGKMWTPTQLGMFFKMNRSFFEDREVNRKLVTDLMNFTAKVNDKIEVSVRENGDRKDNFSQTVNSNLPDKFTLKIPIFKGTPIETLEVETFVQINGREVSFTLISPGANQILEEIRDKAIDDQLKNIREIAPEIVIIEQ